MPSLKDVGHQISYIGVRMLVFVLFLIGSNLARSTLKVVGVRPLAQGIALWILVGATTLFAIRAGHIQL